MSAPRLFELLPAVHRVRDAEREGTLEALLALLDEELDYLRGDVEGLYDNWFVETCDEWVVPYIGDLLGIDGLRSIDGARVSERALVANTIAYRRRKGTAAVLEDLARDVTGWPAKAVEFFSLLGWTQHLNHVVVEPPARDGGRVRLGTGATADLTSASRLELVDTPFDATAHTADVRHVDIARGRHNIPNIGIFLWRIGSFSLERTTARPITGKPECYRFNPLGLDTPLFNVERPERDVTQLAAEPNVPGPVRRRALRDELTGAERGEDLFFARVDPVLRVFVDPTGDDDDLAVSDLAVCDLEPPDRPVPAGVKAAVDPERGRLRIPGATAQTRVEVSWAYGFAGELGGGPYDRQASIEELFEASDPERRVSPVTWQRGVWRDSPTEPGVTATAPQPADRVGLTQSLAAAVAQWEAGPRKEVGLIVPMDSRTHSGNLTIKVPGGTTLIVAAGDWPDEDTDPGATASRRRLGRIDPSGPRPHLLGNITVDTTPGPAGSRPGTLILDGLLIEGAIKVLPGSLGRLRLAHCTVLPDPSGASEPAPLALEVQAGGAPATRHAELELEIVRCSLGPVAVTEFAQAVQVSDSILRGGQTGTAPVPALTGGDVELDRVTLLGSTATRTIEASECIFRDPVQAVRRQSGCVRYSFVPPGSTVPRRYRCVPAEGEVGILPSFVSTDPGDPGYAQLDPGAPEAIAMGAEAGGEMGAFHFGQGPHRVAHLRTRLDEYLRLGLEAGVYFVT
jgi:hypothetical protein